MAQTQNNLTSKVDFEETYWTKKKKLNIKIVNINDNSIIAFTKRVKPKSKVILKKKSEVLKFYL